MKKKLISMAVAMVASGSVLAGSVAGTGGGTEVTQLMNNVQLVQAYEQSVMGYVRQGLQLQNEIDNLIKNPFSLLGKDIGGIINGVGRIMSGANAIAGGVGQIDKNFGTKFKNTKALTLASNFTAWNSTSTSALDKAMESVNLHRADYKSDTDRIAAVVEASNSASGTVGALNTLRDMNLLQIEHTRKLGELLASQNEATNTYMAGKIAKEEAQSQDMEAYKASLLAPRTPISNIDTPEVKYKKWNLY